MIDWIGAFASGSISTHCSPQKKKKIDLLEMVKLAFGWKSPTNRFCRLIRETLDFRGKETPKNNRRGDGTESKAEVAHEREREVDDQREVVGNP